MSEPRRAHKVLRQGGEGAADSLRLDYEGRFLRRKRLVTTGGEAVIVDLAETTSLEDGDALELDDGSRIAVNAAEEPLLHITGDNLPRLAWHIGNRHTPCRIEHGCLLIREDHVLAEMLAGLGALITRVSAPFSPEGGAYGQGRTMGHDHHSHG